MFNFLKKGGQDTGDGVGEYEEISEKRTTKIGYLLLIFMSIFLIGITQTVFSDLKKIPERPSNPAYCLQSIVNGNIENLSYLPSCNFREIDTRFSLDSQYRVIEPTLGKITNLNKQISGAENTIRSNERTITDMERRYELSLQEKIAEERVLFDTSGVQANILRLREDITALKNSARNFRAERDVEIQSISSQTASLKKSYDEANEYYLDKNASYRFKVFLLMLLFVLPFFAISTWLYLKHKRRNSPYTIIFTAVMASAAILFLQIMLVFLYDILPKEWLERIFSLFMSVPFLRYIIYYGSVLVVVAIFGGIVYYIQKKVFDPNKVAVRRLKENKCPNCSFTIDRFQNYCPKCGLQLKEKCSSCDNARINYLKYCPVCGK